MSVDADREGVEHNPHGRRTTASLRAEAEYEEDPTNWGHCGPRCELHRGGPCPPDAWAPTKETA